MRAFAYCLSCGARRGRTFVYPNLAPAQSERSVSYVRGVKRWAKSHPNACGAPREQNFSHRSRGGPSRSKVAPTGGAAAPPAATKVTREVAGVTIEAALGRAKGWPPRDQRWDTYAIRPLIDTRELWREEKQHPAYDPGKPITRPLFADRVDTIVHTDKGRVHCICPHSGEQRDLAFHGFVPGSSGISSAAWRRCRRASAWRWRSWWPWRWDTSTPVASGRCVRWSSPSRPPANLRYRARALRPPARRLRARLSARRG